MFIKYTPAEKKGKDDLSSRAHTNLGEFAPDDVKGPFEDANAEEAKRLIANGDFVETDAGGKEIKSKDKPKAEPTADEIASANTAAAEQKAAAKKPRSAKKK